MISKVSHAPKLGHSCFPFALPGGGSPFDEPFFSFSGTLTSRCLRVTAKSERWSTFAGNSSTRHVETVVLVRF